MQSTTATAGNQDSTISAGIKPFSPLTEGTDPIAETSTEGTHPIAETSTEGTHLVAETSTGAAHSITEPSAEEEHPVADSSSTIVGAPAKKQMSNMDQYYAFFTCMILLTPSENNSKTPVPLSERVYHLTNIFTLSIVKTTVDVCKKGGVPWLFRRCILHLKAAHEAMITGSTATAALQAYSYQFIALTIICSTFVNLCRLIISLYIKTICAEGNVLKTKIKLSQEEAQKEKTASEESYMIGRTMDNDPCQSSDAANKFSFFSQKIFSFFIDLITFIILFGPQLVAISMLAMLIPAAISHQLSAQTIGPRNDLFSLRKTAGDSEHKAEYKYQKEANAHSFDIPRKNLIISAFSDASTALLDHSNELAPIGFLLYGVYSVFNYGADPVWAITTAYALSSVYKELLKYSKVVVGFPKFKNTLYKQAQAVYDIDPDFLNTQNKALSHDYLTGFWGSIIKISIYYAAISILCGLLLTSETTFAPIILNTISNFSPQSVLYRLLGSWLAISFAFTYSKGINYEPKNITSSYILSLTAASLVLFSMWYSTLLYSTYSAITMSVPLYLSLASVVTSILLFDRYAFQSAAIVVDITGIFFSQRIVRLAQLPTLTTSSFVLKASSVLRQARNSVSSYFPKGSEPSSHPSLVVAV
jgi:hypothetical protein